MVDQIIPKLILRTFDTDKNTTNRFYQNLHRLIEELFIIVKILGTLVDGKKTGLHVSKKEK